MKLNTFWKELTRNAPESQGGGAGQPPVEPEAKVETPPVVTPAEGAAPPAAGLDWIPEDYRKDGQPDIDGFKAHYQEIIADQARRAEAEADVPADGKYDFSLADDFDLGIELPEGVKIEIDTSNPLFEEFSQVLKENGISQGVAKGMTGLLAKWEAHKYAETHAAATKEFETLGATETLRNARVDTVTRALQTRLPKDQAEALMGATFSAAGVKALEGLLKPRGIASPNPQPNGADWENLTPMERLKKANEEAMQR